MKQQYQSLSLVAGANLKRLIKEANMTQEEAAEKLLLSEGSCILWGKRTYGVYRSTTEYKKKRNISIKVRGRLCVHERTWN